MKKALLIGLAAVVLLSGIIGFARSLEPKKKEPIMYHGPGRIYSTYRDWPTLYRVIKIATLECEIVCRFESEKSNDTNRVSKEYLDEIAYNSLENSY